MSEHQPLGRRIQTGVRVCQCMNNGMSTGERCHRILLNSSASTCAPEEWARGEKGATNYIENWEPFLSACLFLFPKEIVKKSELKNGHPPEILRTDEKEENQRKFRTWKPFKSSIAFNGFSVGNGLIPIFLCHIRIMSCPAFLKSMIMSIE